ncbi:MAG: GIY-YIG nuclease family protein [Chitinispirillaceae bacterium]|nr:GIY-YIG nuclease family protein [Chitinispirillaceae bacterium]
MLKQPTVYIMASKRNGTLYTGVTSNIIKRVWEHKNDVVPGFTHRYGVHTLVWFEIHPTMESAIKREKCIKGWKRQWKLNLIEKSNQDWHDLYTSITILDSGLRRNDESNDT